MPSRNITKLDVAESYYHVYARGINKQELYLNAADYKYFIKLFERYLSRKISLSKSGVGYPNYAAKVELLCYCLMPNHFHLLLYQFDQKYMSRLMRSIMTSYSRYFNLKYKRTGAVFESTYKASKIDYQSYLEHITRYIHLNPRYYKRYPYSSVKYYTKDELTAPEWINTARILDIFENKDDYKQFLGDYESHKSMLDELRHELADG